MGPRLMVMDLRTFFYLALALLAFALSSASAHFFAFPVRHRFAATPSDLATFRLHDVRRHGRLLSTADIPLGGMGNPTQTGLYFGRIQIGNPPKDYYVQIDTGSDILWVNCAGCDKCPTKSDLGIDLTLYDPKSSSTANYVYCDQDFCTSTYDGQLPGCKPQLQCEYNVVYGDGSSTAGYFVKDALHIDLVTGNLQTSTMNGSIVFGCSAKQSGELGQSSAALDGILGFGQANSSMISQLAAAGKVKKSFAHCLDTVNGGGIFAIGEVASPKVRTTPMVPNQAHYNIILNAIEVGDAVLDLPASIFGSGNIRKAIVDSGTTLAYLPESIYEPLMSQIVQKQSGLKLQTVEEFTCFQFNGDVDKGFPTVKFSFEGSLDLKVAPHEYLFQIRSDTWCFGWLNSGQQSKDGRDMILLGDLVLSNKLVVYDIENQTIGWTDYNCSSNIKVKDDASGEVYAVGATDISSASDLGTRLTLAFMFILVAFLQNSSIH